jgi:S1-C subfamily serine protease
VGTPPTVVHAEGAGVFTAPVGDADPLFASVVRVTSTIVEPDFMKPWTRMAPHTVNASGVVKGSGRILTTAEAIIYASDVQVQIGPSGDKIPAAVLAFDRELDLGTLQIKGPNANEMTQEKFPEDTNGPRTNDYANIYGFPEGESNVAIVPASIDRMDYAPPGSRYEGLHVYINRSFKPGVEGGPVFNERGMLTGLAARGANGAVFVTPVDEIKRFMLRVFGRSKGDIAPRPSVAQHSFQRLENPALRASLGIGPSTHGMLVDQVDGSAATNPFQAMDIVTDIGDAKIDDVGDVLLSTGMRFSYGYAVQATLTRTMSFPGEMEYARQTLATLPVTSETAIRRVVPFRVIRGGNVIDLSVPMTRPGTALMTDLGSDYPPYFILGPVVFSSASRQLMARIDQMPGLEAALSFRGSPLVTRRTEEKAFEGEELVIVTSPLFPHRISAGYKDPSLCVVKTVNGVPIKNLLHLVKVLRDSKDDLIDIEFADSYAESLVFPRSLMMRSTEAILSDNDVPSQGSADTLAVWGAYTGAAPNPPNPGATPQPTVAR